MSIKQKLPYIALEVAIAMLIIFISVVKFGLTFIGLILCLFAVIPMYLAYLIIKHK